MKLTWFGNGSFRIHAGGAIVVIDAGSASHGVNRAELVSGADIVVAPGDSLPPADGLAWKARPVARLLDEGAEPRPPELYGLGEGALLLDADGERPLLVLTGPVPALGRWAERSVMVVAGTALSERAQRLAESAPRLLVLAGAEDEIDAAFSVLRGGLDGTGLMALERGMAVEV